MSVKRIAPLLVVFALEFLLFDHFGARRYTNIYPRWNDQIQYLGESYTGYEYARAHGAAAGAWHTLSNSSPQGTLHDFYALLAFLMAGPSRAAALAINMLALIAWQAALFVAVERRSQSTPLAFACALLPLALFGPWQNIPGSAFDFRLDHLAMCSLGISAAAASLSDGFRSRRGSMLFGFAVGVTLITRFLTGVYFVLMLGALIVWILTGVDRGKRFANLARAVAISLVIAVPVFWRNWDAVVDYYWIGHYVGPESGIRDPHMGLGRSIQFVFGALCRQHVGYFLLGIVFTGSIALALLRDWRKSPRPSFPSLVGAVFLLAPALALILHQQKSEAVVSALVPGVLMLVVELWVWLAATVDHRRQRGFAVIGLIMVGANFTHTQVPPIYSPSTLAELRTVNAVADEIFQRLRAARSNELVVAVDYITDCFDAQVLRLVIYERHHVWLHADMTLPTSIAAPDSALVMSRLEKSDFVFVTKEAPPGLFPYDRKLEAMRPQVQAWCEAHLRGANEFSVFGRRMMLYQRREIPFP